MSLRLVRLASVLIVSLGLCALPDRGEAAPAKGAAAPAGAKPAKGAKAKPAKDPDDDDGPVKAPADAPAAPAAPAAKSAPAKGAKAKPAKPGASGAAAAAPEGVPAVPPEDAATPGATPAPAPPPEDLPPSDMEGTDENPDAPVDYDVPRPETKTVVAPRPPGYPIEEVFRPLTLPRFMTEVALDTRFTFNPFINGSALRARFGITPKAQVGLVYNIGGVYKDGTRSTAFNTGKAVAITGAYQIKEWLSASIALPMYLEPFASSITLGAPMKFRFADRYALIIAEDVIDIRLAKFVPSLTSEAENEINVTNEDTNTRTSEGNFRFSGAGVFQYKPDLAFNARLAVTIIDFNSQKLGYLLKVGVQKTLRKNLDLSALMGCDDLSNADGTFGFVLGAAFRI